MATPAVPPVVTPAAAPVPTPGANESSLWQKVQNFVLTLPKIAPETSTFAPFKAPKIDGLQKTITNRQLCIESAERINARREACLKTAKTVIDESNLAKKTDLIKGLKTAISLRKAYEFSLGKFSLLPANLAPGALDNEKLNNRHEKLVAAAEKLDQLETDLVSKLLAAGVLPTELDPEFSIGAASQSPISDFIEKHPWVALGGAATAAGVGLAALNLFAPSQGIFGLIDNASGTGKLANATCGLLCGSTTKALGIALPIIATAGFVIKTNANERRAIIDDAATCASQVVENYGTSVPIAGAIATTCAFGANDHPLRVPVILTGGAVLAGSAAIYSHRADLKKFAYDVADTVADYAKGFFKAYFRLGFVTGAVPAAAATYFGFSPTTAASLWGAQAFVATGMAFGK